MVAECVACLADRDVQFGHFVGCVVDLPDGHGAAEERQGFGGVTLEEDDGALGGGSFGLDDGHRERVGGVVELGERLTGSVAVSGLELDGDCGCQQVEALGRR